MVVVGGGGTCRLCPDFTVPETATAVAEFVVFFRGPVFVVPFFVAVILMNSDGFWWLRGEHYRGRGDSDGF